MCMCTCIHVCSCVCEELEFQISTACSVHRQHPAILVNCAVPWRCMVFEFKGKLYRSSVQIASSHWKGNAPPTDFIYMPSTVDDDTIQPQLQ